MELKKSFSVSEQDGVIEIYLKLDTWKGGVRAKCDDVEKFSDFLNLAILYINRDWIINNSIKGDK